MAGSQDDAKNEGQEDAEPGKATSNYALTDEDRQHLETVFRLMDHNRDGLIDARDLGRLLQRMNMTATERELTAMIMAQHDAGSGTPQNHMNFEGFCAMMQRSNAIRSSLTDTSEVKAIFRIIDKNRDGRISMAELRESMRSVTDSVSDAEIAQMFRAADTNQDGFISFEEFAEMTRMVQQYLEQEEQQQQQQQQPQKKKQQKK